MGEVGISPEQDPNQRFHRTPQADGVLDSDEIDVGSINVVTDDVVEVYFKKTDEDDLPAVYMNIFVACFTTWWARLHLYEALELSQERCLYFDTDSVMSVSEPGQPNPQLGQSLGEQEVGSRLDGDDFSFFIV